MHIIHLAALGTLALAIHSQTPTSARPQAESPPPTPTMEQTIAFINDAFAKQGAVSYKVTALKSDYTIVLKDQTIRPTGACSLSYAYVPSSFLAETKPGALLGCKE